MRIDEQAVQTIVALFKGTMADDLDEAEVSKEALLDFLSNRGIERGVDSSLHSMRVGDHVFVQQVTHNYRGIVTKVYQNRVVLSPVYAVNQTGKVDDCMPKKVGGTFKFQNEEQMPDAVELELMVQATNVVVTIKQKEKK